MSSIFLWSGLFILVAGPVIGFSYDIVGAIIMGIGVILMIIGR